ncbi:MAG: STAS domain-containing protein [Thermoleophilaceae bacterium]
MPLSPVIRVESTLRGAARVVAVAGELDISSVARIRQALDDAIAERPEELVLDLSGLEFCDSSGIHLVVETNERAAQDGIHFSIVRPTGPAWRVFEVCRIEGDLDFVDSA